MLFLQSDNLYPKDINMKIFRGNLLTVTRGILVHGCNCQGVMGGGVALAVRETYPEAFERYRQHQTHVGLTLGDVVFAWNLKGTSYLGAAKQVLPSNSYSSGMPQEVIVANALTQFNYGRDPQVRYVDYDAVAAAFSRVKLVAQVTGLPVCFPMLGAGLANGDWRVIEGVIEKALGPELFEQAQLWAPPGQEIPGHPEPSLL